MFRKPGKKEWLYLLLVAAMYASALVYAHYHDLFIGAVPAPWTPSLEREPTTRHNS